MVRKTKIKSFLLIVCCFISSCDKKINFTMDDIVGKWMYEKGGPYNDYDLVSYLSISATVSKNMQRELKEIVSKHSDHKIIGVDCNITFKKSGDYLINFRYFNKSFSSTGGWKTIYNMDKDKTIVLYSNDEIVSKGSVISKIPSFPSEIFFEEIKKFAIYSFDSRIVFKKI